MTTVEKVSNSTRHIEANPASETADIYLIRHIGPS